MEVTFALAEQMLLLAKVADTKEEARAKLEKSISSGAALAKFRDLVAAHGCDANVVYDPAQLPQAKHQVALTAAQSGYVAEVDAMEVALAALRLGAGRAKAEDAIDPAVGVSDLVKVGERVEADSRLCTIHANDESALAEAKTILSTAISLIEKPVTAPRLIGKMIG